eukprot:8930443-Alexandrium_andersonii.AAC.1
MLAPLPPPAPAWGPGSFAIIGWPAAAECRPWAALARTPRRDMTHAATRSMTQHAFKARRLGPY